MPITVATTVDEDAGSQNRNLHKTPEYVAAAESLVSGKAKVLQVSGDATATGQAINASATRYKNALVKAVEEMGRTTKVEWSRKHKRFNITLGDAEAETKAA